MTQGHAQTARNRLHAAFNDFRRQMHEDFDDFRRQCMEEFLQFVSEPWESFKGEEPVPLPQDETVPPVVPDDDEQEPPEDDTPVVIDEVVKPQPTPPQPQPVAPIEEEPVEQVRYVDFTSYGTPMRVRFNTANRVSMNRLNERGVADAMRQMSQRGHDNLLIDCLALRDSIGLCDWAYIHMLGDLAIVLE